VIRAWLSLSILSGESGTMFSTSFNMRLEALKERRRTVEFFFVVNIFADVWDFSEIAPHFKRFYYEVFYKSTGYRRY
jgi:hypothetical protein